MKRFALQIFSVLFFASLAYSQNSSQAQTYEFPKTAGKFGHVAWMATVPDGRRLSQNLEAVIQTYLPGARQDKDWKVIIEDPTTFLHQPNSVIREYDGGHYMFPPRCLTWRATKVTECIAAWAREFSQASKAGTLAHEYGHILCGHEEADADRCAIRVLRAGAENQP